IPDEAPATSAGRRSGWGSNLGMSFGDLYRKGREASDIGGMDTFATVLVDLVVGDAPGELLERDVRLEAGQVCAETEVHSPTEARDLLGAVASDAEVVGGVEDVGVAVGGSYEQQDLVAGPDGGVVQFDVGDGGAGDDLARGVVAEGLLDPLRCTSGIAEQL